MHWSFRTEMADAYTTAVGLMELFSRNKEIKPNTVKFLQLSFLHIPISSAHCRRAYQSNFSATSNRQKSAFELCFTNRGNLNMELSLRYEDYSCNRFPVGCPLSSGDSDCCGIMMIRHDPVVLISTRNVRFMGEANYSVTIS